MKQNIKYIAFTSILLMCLPTMQHVQPAEYGSTWRERAAQYTQSIATSVKTQALNLQSFYTHNKSDIKHITERAVAACLGTTGALLTTDAMITYALGTPSMRETILPLAKLELSVLLPLLACQSDTKLLHIFQHNQWRQQAKICANLPASALKALTKRLPSIAQAVKNNDQTAIEYYLYTDIRDKYDNSILHIATQQKNNTLVQFLIEHGANPNTQNDANEGPLHTAAKNGNYELIQYFINHGADMTMQNAFGSQPIDYTFDVIDSFCDLRAAKTLIQNGADISYRSLRFACTFDLADAARLLLFHGGDVNATDDQGHALLHYAAAEGNLQTVQLLFDFGAQPNARDNQNELPFSQDEEVQAALEKARDDNAWLEHQQTTDSQWLIEQCNASMLSIYNHTHDPDLLTHFSVYGNLYHQNNTHDIIAQGDAPHIWTVYALRCNHNDALSSLIEQPNIYKNINKKQDDQGNRLLHTAAQYNRPDMIAMLLCIADPTDPNNDNQTACDIVDMYNYPAIKKLFYTYKHIDETLQRGTRVDNANNQTHITDLPPEMLKKITGHCMNSA